MTKIKTLVIAGGGIKGIGLLGAISQLQKEGLLSDVDTFIGSSVGALLGLLFACGFTDAEIATFCLERNLYKLAIPWYTRNVVSYLYNLYRGNGLYSLNHAMRVIKKIVVKRLHVPASSLTFQELYKLTGQTLVMTATCTVHQNTLVLSRFGTPDLNIFDALRATIALPFVFTCKKLDMTIPTDECGGHLCVDGGMLNNTPTIYGDVLAHRKSLRVVYKESDIYNTPVSPSVLLVKCSRLASHSCALAKKSSVPNVVSFGIDLINAMLSKIEQVNNLRSLSDRTVVVGVPSNIGAADFGLGKTAKKTLFELGVHSAEIFLAS